MNEKKVNAGKPHILELSPCESCKQEKRCPAPCEGWKNWMRESWQTVTGRKPRHE